ncbi:hypothetical protein PP182_07285 [Maribacter sp. PR1]|uniref:Uncharacterized protein n=1 Tax=Maribacter cobaltidurans TaxID=1178778 RepID=A0ABU7ISR6_9FLAO|nr:MULTISPECIES: hypothetical protein [Maribacter]MDC6388479.1 hypothetical protein [Maribacter sp. PR1]MEE1975868.1 hypothetical protein [Maribacter cobaltidurans]
MYFKNFLIKTLFLAVVVFVSSCAKDNEDGNENQVNLNDLITINIPEDYLHGFTINSVVFASKMDGSLLASSRFTFSDRVVVLHTEENFPSDEEYMLTFALTDSGYATHLLTYANLTKTKISEINLKQPLRYPNGTTNTYTASGFQTSDGIHSFAGLGNSGTLHAFYFEPNRTNFNLIQSQDKNAPPYNKIYFFGQPNTGFPEYSYLMLDLPLNNDFSLNKNEFLNEGIDSRSFTIYNPYTSKIDRPPYLLIYGYLTENDEQFHLFHSVSFTGAYTGTDNYFYTSNLFHSFWYKIYNGDYYAEKRGLPGMNFEVPNLSIDYTLKDLTINLDVKGTDHEVGKIQLLDYESNNSVNYIWNFSFDSQKISSIIIPEFPPEMDPSQLQGYYESKTFKVGSAEIYNYFGFDTYDDYITKIVKDQNHFFQVSQGFEMSPTSDYPMFNFPIDDNISE